MDYPGEILAFTHKFDRICHQKTLTSTVRFLRTSKNPSRQRDLPDDASSYHVEDEDDAKRYDAIQDRRFDQVLP